jgi:hypothetical protein
MKGEINMLNWENSTERFGVIMNNKIMDTRHGTISMSYNDLRKIWYDDAYDHTDEAWAEIVESTPELKDAFFTILEIYIQLHPCLKRDLGPLHFHKFEI